MVMRIAVVADSHFDEHSRFDECKRLHAWIHDDARERGVTLTLHTGDVYERKSTPLEREAAASWFQSMALLGPVVIVRGNHDFVDDLPLLERLDALHPIHVVQDARVLRFDEVSVAAVAWPRKAALLAAFGSQSIEDGQRSAADALRSVFRGLGDELRHANSGPRLLAMHAMVRDSVTSTGQPLVGCDLEVGLEDLALLDAHAYLLGHVHKGQDWRIGAAPCIYPGSPRRTAFGESETKGYVIVDTDERGVTGWEFVPVPATPMVHVSAVWEDRVLRHEEVGSVRGAEVRLRYTTPSDQRIAAAAAADSLRDSYLAGGALHVKVEAIVLAEQRARAPELARAQTLEEKLEALWRAQGFEPGERREALLGKVRQLEEGRRAA